MKNISIIWSENDTRESFRDFSFAHDLDLYSLCSFKADRAFGELELRLESFFTTNQETMVNRCEMFFELTSDPELFGGLSKSFSDLADICRLKQEKDGWHSNELMLYSVKELEMYVEYIEETRRLFSDHPVKSAFLCRLRDEIQSICSSGKYESLAREVKKQSHLIKHAQSVTIAVNLDAQMHPLEAGVVTVNDVRYESGLFIDKLLRLDFKDSEYKCSAPLIPVDKRLSEEEIKAFRFTLNGALNKVFASALKSWEKTVRRYVIDDLDRFFPLLYEWKFVSSAAKALMSILDAGQTFCRPIFADRDKIEGLYHPLLALSGGDRVVKNDLVFDRERIYILTGPNQGGKSIYTKSVGLLYAMLHLGLPLPAAHVEICPVDGIFTHFIDNRTEHSYRHGRLEAECEAIQRVNERITERSIFLFDESLSSTSADEAITIATELLSAYSAIGVRGIFTTHLHGLCRLAEQGNNSNICNLTAELDENSHDRTYRIRRGGRGYSYASDIAKKYHLTREEILSMQKNKTP